MGPEPIHLRFQKLIRIFFHAMGRNAELQEDMGLSTGLGSDVILCDKDYTGYCLILLSILLVSFFPLASPDSNLIGS